MTVTDVIDHFGGIAETARALSISYQAVQQWSDNGKVPKGRQWELQAMTKGVLKVETAAA